ncbi:MAG: hypothetical protein Q4D42_01520 [Eubacteriales bacterium]|nr:hypothetical protein [Eubacteriales bacterium]
MRRKKISIRAVKRLLRAHTYALRSLLIVVLVAALAVQSWHLWSKMLPEREHGASWLSSRGKQTVTDNSAAAMPIRFAARSSQGMYGVAYHTDGLQEAYEATADIWAQAFEQAQEPSAAQMEQYRSALQNNLLLMEYDGKIPMHILAGWLHCGMPEDMEDLVIGTVALCRVGNGEYTLFFRDSSMGTLRCADTHVDDDAFDAATGQFESNGCVLAVDEDASTASPELLYFSDSTACSVMSFAPYNGVDGIDDLLTAFGLDAAAAQNSSYTSNGADVYVSGSNTVRISQDGSMTYDGMGVRIGTAHGHDRIMQCVQTGYGLTEAALDAINSGAAPTLTAAYTDADSGQYIVVFGIQINGIPVDNTRTGYFARYAFEGNGLAHADLALRTCQTTGETVAVMPEKQAAAGQVMGTDASLSLRYIDEAAGTDSAWDAYEEDLEPTSQEPASGDTAGDELTEDTAEEDPAAGEQNMTSIWEDIDVTPADDAAAEERALGNTGSVGTDVSPQWYVLQYGDATQTPDTGRTLAPEDIVVVDADFDHLIRGGAAQ